MGERIRREPEAGFTLIELMVVILIVGILIAIALPTYLGARSRAQDRAAETNLRTGLAAAMTYWAEAGSYTGFDTTQASAAEPSLGWQPPGAPVADRIAIQVANGSELLLVDRSRSGTYFCLAQLANSPAFDKGKSATFASLDTTPECTGGW